MNYFRYALITLLCKIKEFIDYVLQLLCYSPSEDFSCLIPSKLIQEKATASITPLIVKAMEELLVRSILLSLPDDVLKLIFTWMALRDVMKLDSAMTSHSCRKMWLKTSGRLYCHPGYIFQSNWPLRYIRYSTQMFDGRFIVQDDQQLKILDWQSNHAIPISCLPQKETVIFRTSKNKIVMADCEILKVWDPARPNDVVSIVGHSFNIRSIVELSDGQIASVSKDSLRIWDINKQPPELTEMFTESLHYLVPLSNCRLFAAPLFGNYGVIFYLKELNDTEEIYPSGHIISESNYEIPDDRLLLHLYSCVEIWNTKTWTVQKRMNIAINYGCMCLPLDYKHHVAVTSSDGRIKIYNLETGEVEQILQEAAGSNARNLLGTARKSSSFYSYSSSAHYLWTSKD